MCMYIYIYWGIQDTCGERLQFANSKNSPCFIRSITELNGPCKRVRIFPGFFQISRGFFSEIYSQATQGTGKQASKPASQPASKPASQQASKPASQQASKPASQQASKQASKPASQQASKPASQPASKQASQQASKPASQQASKPASQQASQQASKPASKQANEQTSKRASEQASKQGRKHGSQQSEKVSKPCREPARQPARQQARKVSNQALNKYGARLQYHPPYPCAQAKDIVIPYKTAFPGKPPPTACDNARKVDDKAHLHCEWMYHDHVTFCGRRCALPRRPPPALLFKRHPPRLVTTCKCMMRPTFFFKRVWSNLSSKFKCVLCCHAVTKPQRWMIWPTNCYV